MAFRYKTRTAEDIEKRASQQGGDYEGWIKDEYRSYTPKKGDNAVRIMPPSPNWDSNHYGMDVWVHYGIGPERASVICLFKMKQERCPICEERARAERAGDEDLAKELKPARRVLAFIIDRKDESQGVLAWGMPYTLDRDIAKISKDRSTGEYYFVDHPENGWDVYFDRDGEGIGTKYGGMSLSRRPSSVPEKILSWIEDNPIPNALRWRTYDEVKRLYDGAGRGGAVEAGRPEDKPEERREPPPREEERQPDRREPDREPAPQQADEKVTHIAPRRAARDAEQGNGGREIKDPPFEVDKKPETTAGDPPPASSGKSRAEQLREKFNAARPQ